MSEKIWSDDAWNDYLYWQTQDKKILNVSTSLLKILSVMVVCRGLENRSRLPVIYRGSTVAGSMKKIVLFIIQKTVVFILHIAEDIMERNSWRWQAVKIY